MKKIQDAINQEKNEAKKRLQKDNEAKNEKEKIRI